MSDIYFVCLHCSSSFLLRQEDFNCRILRHACFKSNLEPVNPHLPKSECERLVREGLVYGCCKPLQIIERENSFQVIKCDYI